MSDPIVQPRAGTVVLLCHCDGTNGSTAFIDATGRHTLTATNATITTTAPKFGSGCANLASGASARIDTGSTNLTDFNFGSGQFTVEGWAYFTGSPGTTNHPIISQWGSGWYLGMATGANLTFYWSTTGADAPNVSYAGFSSPTLNTWYHIAADRDASNVIRLYLNGAVVASTTSGVTFFNSTQLCLIGNDSGFTDNFPGHIDEVRVTKGLAQYGGAFTPPSAPFLPADPGAGAAQASVMVMA